MIQILNSVSFKLKILGISSILLLFLMGTSGYALYVLQSIGVEVRDIAELNIPMTRKLSTITEHQLDLAQHLERAVRFGGLAQINADALKQLKIEIGAYEELLERIEQISNGAATMADKGLALANTEQEEIAFRDIAKGLEEMTQDRAALKLQAREMFQALLAGSYNEALAQAEGLEPLEERIETALFSLKQEIEKFTVNSAQVAREHKQRAVWTLGIMAVVALLLGLFLSLLVSMNLIRRLNAAISNLGVIATGDLTQTVEIDGSDEIGVCQQSIQRMQQDLTRMLSEISDSTVLLASTSEEVSQTMLQTANNIQEQQTETEEVMLAMNEMSLAVKEVSESVHESAEVTSRANQEAGNGKDLVQTTIQGINKLASQIEESAQVVVELEQDSDNISTVLDVIKSIAEQTNLLALNAAIEAARAGEQGRGFAVVADEVRTLAGRTQDSTEEINQIIEKLQKGAKKATSSMLMSKDNTEQVVDSAQQAGLSLDTITGSVAEVDERSARIAAAAEQQNEVAGHMSANITRVNEVAMHNAASVEQTTVAGQEIARIAETLQILVDKFKVSTPR